MTWFMPTPLVWRLCRECWATNGLAAVPESGVKKGDVNGLRGVGEKEGTVSVKAVFRDAWLSERNGLPLPISG